MSRKLWPAPLAGSPELVTINFRFQINGTSDPDAVVPGNALVTNVTRTSAGVFAVTFGEIFPVFIGANGAVMSVTAGEASYGLIVQTTPGSYSTTTGILTVHVVDPYTDATPAAADPTDNNWVYVSATFCRKSTMAPSAAV